MVRIAKGNLKASTLVESIIAMVLIVLSIGIAMMIYLNVLNSDKQLVRYKAALFLTLESKKAKDEYNYIDEEKVIGNWKFIKQVFKFEQSENLIHIRLLLIDKEGKLIAERNELLIEK